jgi:FlaA1/EpsC-like NDP-sugar epimerase
MVVQSWFVRLFTRRIQFIFDLSVLVLAFALSYVLRFDFAIPSSEISNSLTQLPYVVLLQITTLYFCGIHRFIWRYIGLSEIRPFIKAALLSALPMFILRIALPSAYQHWRIPYSIIISDTILAFGGVLMLRVIRRVLYERYEKRSKTMKGNASLKRSVLLIGAGRAGVLAANEIMTRGDIDLEVKGFIDDDTHKQKTIIRGIKVLGTTADLPKLVGELEIDHVVITIAQTSRENIRNIIEACERIPVRVRIIPGLYEILEGRVELTRFRDIQIEDLLGRAPIELDLEEMGRFLAGKTVMVSGAGGSIGSELARQVARFQVARLLLVERAEGALFNIHREICESWPELDVLPLVADIGDEARLRSIFARVCPQVILHAAAHKHVPMMEMNPVESVKNNVLATHLLGDLAGEFGVESFVLISTDKAVRPTSVMGASKRMAELIVQDLNQRYLDTRYLAVRFGNVIGSAGSVIPIFREQIRKGGPVTVTHKDMERYFMTIPEAAQLVLQASTMGHGGEIFILDMGKPMRILDLAIDTIKLSGLKPDQDIKIVFTGVRPGEKLTEELQIPEEQVETRHPKIFINKIAVQYSREDVHQALEQLSYLSATGQDQEIRPFLNKFLPRAKLEVASETPGKDATPVLSGEFRM